MKLCRDVVGISLDFVGRSSCKDLLTGLKGEDIERLALETEVQLHSQQTETHCVSLPPWGLYEPVILE